MSDASGYLPPHELRSPLANATSRESAESGRVPGPAAALGSPGLASAATSGSPLAPAFAMDDPAALALGISRVVDEQFGASLVPLPTPDAVTSGAGASLPASPGVTPALSGTPDQFAVDDPVLLANLARVIDAQLAASIVPWPDPSTNAAAPASPGIATAAPSGVPSFAMPSGMSDTALPADVERVFATGIGAPSASDVGVPSASGVGTPSASDVGAPTGVGAPSASRGGAPSTSGGGAPSSAGAPIRSFDDIAARINLAATPGIAPQLAAVGSQPTYEPTIAAAPDVGAPAPSAAAPGVGSSSAPAVPTVPGVGSSSAVVLGGAPNAPASLAGPRAPQLGSFDSFAGVMHVPFAAPPPTGMPSAPSAPHDPAAPVRLGAIDEFGGVMHVPFADVPVLDQITASAPPMGGSQAWQSPPHVGLDHGAAMPAVEHAAPALDVPGWTGEHVPFVEARRVEAHESPVRQSGGVAFDPYRVRRDFPILDERVHGKRLVWLDNAATTQKPRSVIDRLTYYYEHENSNVHRGAHALAARATDAFESARETTRKFLNASSASEIVFVRGATEGINLIAKAYGARHVERGDEIVLTHLEHHANIVPWQQLCAETGARLRVAPVDDRGDVILDEFEKLLCSRTRIVAFTQVSNALGTITPAREMIEIAHRWGATVVLDGAQAVSHMAVDVQELDCDFYVFSGHKVFAPTGIGAVYGKRAVLDAMPPWQGGGNMIQDVTFERTLYQPPPWRFEAGTGNIADAAGMGSALDYVMRIGMTTIDRYEHELLEYATERLCTVRGLHLIGAARRKAGVLSFILDGQRTEDVGSALDKHGIAVRSGHHCAQPILRRFGLEASIRASLAFYNVREDIDALERALHEIQASV